MSTSVIVTPVAPTAAPLAFPLTYKRAGQLVLAACAEVQTAGYKLDADRADELAYLWRIGPALAGTGYPENVHPLPLRGTPLMLALRFGGGIGPYIILSREGLALLRVDPRLGDALTAAIRSAARELREQPDVWAVALCGELMPSGEVTTHERRVVTS